MANNTHFPAVLNNSTNWVRNNMTTHRAGPLGYLTVQPVWCNWLVAVGSNSELNGSYQFELRAGLFVNGQFYPFTFGGSRDVTVPVTKGTYVKADALAITIAPGQLFQIMSRTIASDGGVAGTYAICTGASGLTFRIDGVLAGTDPGVDYTTGGFPHGVMIHLTIAGDGTSSGIVVDNNGAGTGYTGGSLNTWLGAGAMNGAASTPGFSPYQEYPCTTKPAGFGNASGGAITSVTRTNNGAGMSANNPPPINLSGAGGFGVSTAVYGPCLILGVPLFPGPDLLIEGDSIAAGIQSVDGSGDLSANYGCYEKNLQNLYGFTNTAVASQTIVGFFSGGATNQHAVVTANRVPSHVLIALGSNDFAASSALSSIVNAMKNEVGYWKGLGSRVGIATILPRVTAGTFSAAPGSQTPTNAAFATGGDVDTFNGLVRTLDASLGHDWYVDPRATAQDATVTQAWRRDVLGSDYTYPASDGIHPSVPVGIEHLAANMSFSPLTTAKTFATAVAYDASGNFALAKAALVGGTPTVVDSGTSGPLTAAELAETLGALGADGSLITSALYSSGLLANAQADAVTLAGRL